MITCLDTTIVVWGVQGLANPDRVDMIDRTRRYLDHAAKKNETLMIPSVVLAEYLIQSQTPMAELGVIVRRFFVPSFDTACALLAAEIQQDRNLIAEVRGATGIDRQRIRIDAMMIATAVVHGADRILYDDHHIAALAGNRVKVETVPDIKEQGNLNFGSDAD
jgi:predicted nucleic acid-binding protein